MVVKRDTKGVGDYIRMKLVSVVLDIPTQALDSTFTYAVVENENDRIRLFEAAIKANQSTDVQTTIRQSQSLPNPFRLLWTNCSVNIPLKLL